MARLAPAWWRSGEPFVWFTASAVTVSLLAVLALVGLVAVRGLAHFWPHDIWALEVETPGRGDGTDRLLGELARSETLPLARYRSAVGADAGPVPAGPVAERVLVRTANRDLASPDFRWVWSHRIVARERPAAVVELERTAWGNALGLLVAVEEARRPVAGAPWEALRLRTDRARGLRARIDELVHRRLAPLNRRIEGLERRGREDALEALRAERAALGATLRELERALDRDRVVLETLEGRRFTVPLRQVVRAWRPNAMGTAEKLAFYFAGLGDFLSEGPREANTEGGVFPALFGTVLMVLLMSALVTPLGVLAAVYLSEYAGQGTFTRMIRIAVHNLAGVPSIVYGVFGLGFFVYVVGGTLDELFFAEKLPAPTFGTPGLLWASMTLALLTVPVVIVSTEEGLARIPRTLREGSLALGATRAETLLRVVLPMATPAMLTGVILAIARAAGEVAPLMLVGVVKLAPELPVDGAFPFVHLERKFMHLGFHIYDVGFQSPNVDAARPLVYATALLLVALVVLLNLAAILLRARLRRRYRALAE
jgi:phosphate transport system permease protein